MPFKIEVVMLYEIFQWEAHRYLWVDVNFYILILEECVIIYGTQCETNQVIFLCTNISNYD